ncbi:MAG: YchF/TatD family DNA exonuclease [Thermodesulfovibrionales bacterium]|nr:YchF/TatD family DNA exonuclease [Thermodesulfovibrionales bacterium]
MIDTHCHLEMDAFDNDREDVIKRAREAGLEAIITIGSDFEGCKGAVELASKYDFIYATVGIHPHDAKDFTEEIFNQIKRWAKGEGQKAKGKIVAIGEIGLDYHYDHSPRDIQKDVFKKQLYYAREINLPVIIHSREAKKDTLKILEESGVTKGVMHCFSGDMEMAERVMSLGFYISIAGPVTFKNAAKSREIAKAIPDDYLLVETDAPYLTPEPLRGKRNEPAFVVHTAKFIAELRGISYEDIDRITTVNAKRLFGIGEMPEAEIAYRIRDSLYLNVTNRCTSKCTFCVKFHTDFVKGHKLRLEHEPTEEELKNAIGDPTEYKEVVFCGYGEPLLRLDAVKSVASWVKGKGGKVRINTNGHGNLIHKRNILPELQGLVDSISISLDAQDEETYNRICRPAFKNAFNEVVNFIREAKKYIPDVTATVVTAEGVDVDKCREITDSLGVKLRVRRLDVVG